MGLRCFLSDSGPISLVFHISVSFLGPVHSHAGKSLVQKVFKYLSHGSNVYVYGNDIPQTTFLIIFSFLFYIAHSGSYGSTVF